MPRRLKSPPSPPPAVQPTQAEEPPVPLNDGIAPAVVRALQRQAQEARTDPTKFYNFVFRHETTKAPLKAAPHQELMFRFVLDHPLCVVRQPIGTGKTFCMAALGLYFLGNDVTQRGAIVAKAQGQSSKVVRMVSDYLTDPNLGAPLQMVFPWLRKSERPGDQWTLNQLTVARSAGIRDPSLVAVGLDGQIQGARLSWILGDDILDADNTLTAEGREQTHSRFDGRFISRLDPTGSRCVVTNTPWHLQDMTFRLEEIGWPSMTMNIFGDVWFSQNVSEQWIAATGLLRPSTKSPGKWRFVAFDPDPEETTPLWEERYSLKTIAQIRATRLPTEFARLFLCTPLDESALRCQRSWIEAAKRKGRGMRDLLGQTVIGLPTYTGVDIGIGAQGKHDLTSFFTFQTLETGERRIVEVDAGRFSGPEILKKVLEKHDRFDSMVSVEGNSAQDFIRQFAREDRPNLRIRAHTTSKASKHSIDFGVESIFSEFQAGRWIIPCDEDGATDAEVERFLEECLYYQPPPAHTGDRLMSAWIARESSRVGGGGRDPRPRAASRLRSHGVGGF